MRVWICAAAANGFIAVAVASFAAHGLGEAVAAERLDWVDTGVRYQIVHALALLAVALLHERHGDRPRTLGVAGWGFLLGTVLFAGGLYVMAFSGWRGIGVIVPLGGIAFLIGWAALFIFGLRMSQR